MLLSQRQTLTILAVVVLGWAVGPYPGGYSGFAVALALAAAALAVVGCVLPDRPHSLAPAFGDLILTRTAFLLIVMSGVHFFRERDPAAVFVGLASAGMVGGLRFRPVPWAGSAAIPAAAGGLLLTGYAVLLADQAYVLRPGWQMLVRCAAAAGFILQMSLLSDLHVWPARQRFFGVRLVLLFVLGAALRLGAILAAPQPIIDVFTALDEAPLHILHGHNPYTAVYSDPYASELAVRHGIREPPFSLEYPFYPPLPFFLALPFRAVGLDGRCANIVCDLIAALALYLAARRRSNHVLGAILAGTYLNLPRVPFLMESAWYEPMIAAFLGFGLVLLDASRRLGFVLVGLGLTAKQFGVALLPSLAWGGRGQWHWIVMGLGVGVLTWLPFVAADPAAFGNIVVVQHLGRPPIDSITAGSGAERALGLTLPRPMLWAVATGLIGWVAARAPKPGASLGLWLGTALLIFVLCHTQGYINYFYLAQYLLLLGAAGSTAKGPEQGAEGAATGPPAPMGGQASRRACPGGINPPAHPNLER